MITCGYLLTQRTVAASFTNLFVEHLYHRVVIETFLMLQIVQSVTDTSSVGAEVGEMKRITDRHVRGWDEVIDFDKLGDIVFSTLILLNQGDAVVDCHSQTGQSHEQPKHIVPKKQKLVGEIRCKDGCVNILESDVDRKAEYSKVSSLID